MRWCSRRGLASGFEGMVYLLAIEGKNESEKVNHCRGSVVLPHFFMLENRPLSGEREGKMSPMVTQFREKELVNTGLAINQVVAAAPLSGEEKEWIFRQGYGKMLLEKLQKLIGELKSVSSADTI